MSKPHKHAELIKAWADGAQIQFQSLRTFEWHDAANPNWNTDYEYRIKPDPKPDVVKCLNIYKSGKKFDCATSKVKSVHQCLKSSGDFLRGRVKLTIDGETGKLKSAEVLK